MSECDILLLNTPVCCIIYAILLSEGFGESEEERKTMGTKFGDRRDGVKLKKIHSMHVIMPLIFPNRTDNEAFIAERIDLSGINSYLEKKNADGPEYKYNLFQVIVTAALKAIVLRPKMNRFITNNTMYMHKEVSASFTVKKEFSDEGGEALARVSVTGTETIDDIHNSIYRQVSFCRSDKVDASTDAMNTIQRLPGFVLKFVGCLVRFLDRHGWLPKSMISTDPYQSSILLSNLGSIGLKAGYHHLANWGTTSVFCTIGKAQKAPFFREDGTVEMKDSVDIGLTIDERIADGYYYSRTVQLLKKLLENPELLERPLNEEVEF